jgi:hypothetical protein
MIPNSRDSLNLIERNDGRQDYLLHDGDKYLLNLSEVGSGIVSVPGIPDEQIEAYVTALDAINGQYFDAREFEERVRGKFHRYDEEAERNLRSAVAEGASDTVGSLHDLLSAYETICDTIRSSDSVDGDRERLSRAVDTYTNRAIRQGWYPVVKSHDHALNPGERIAEGKTRKRHRLYGESDMPGVSQLLDTALFDQVTRDDLSTVRTLDAKAPDGGTRVSTRLVEHHRWLLDD